MGRSSGMGQLTKGIVIGFVLLLAIIGTMSIFDQAKNNKNPLDFSHRNNPSVQNTPEVASPSINVNTPKEQPDQSNNTNDSANNSVNKNTSDTENAKNNAEAENPNPNVDSKEKTQTAKSNNNFTPILENERVLKEKPIKKKYGLLQVSAVNAKSRAGLLASFVVLDKAGKKVAQAKDVKSTSFRLPVGKYKVITTLQKSAGSRRAKPVQSTKMIRITNNKKTTRVFRLELPSSLGVLQVSSKSSANGKVLKANYIIQKENGKTIATRTNVTHTLFKLKAGSYKVIVKSGNQSDFRTIVVEPGESTQEVFILKETLKQGQLLVRVMESRSSKPVRADIIITSSKGTPVQQLRDVSQTELSLPTGKYKIRVTGPNGQSSKNITVAAGRKLNEVFRFSVLKKKPENEVQITENVKITPIKTTPAPRSTPQVTPAIIPADILAKKPKPVAKVIKGSLKLYARNEGDNVPLRSNFYVQLPNGKNIAKKVYSNSAQFSLDPGVYRITVRSKNRKNIIKTIRVVSGKSSTEVFSLVSTLPKKPKPQVKPQPKPQNNPQKIAQAPARMPVLAPAKPAKPLKPKPAVAAVKPKPAKPLKPKPAKTNAIPTGFLSISMQPPQKTHFIVSTRSGKKIVELTSVPSANFKLDTGQYVVTAIRNKRRRSKNVNVRTNKTIHLAFKAINFQPPRRNPRNPAIAMGVLRSRIVNQNGQSLRGDLTIKNARGQIVARANAVTVGVFDLPPGPHTVILNYKGLRGSERINIRPRETTMQTFTIAQNRSQPR